MDLEPKQSESLVTNSFNESVVVSFGNLMHLDKENLLVVSENFDVETVLMVGAVPDSTKPYGLSEDDLSHFSSTLYSMSLEGISISSNPYVSYMNIAEEFGGEDFLTNLTYADLIIFCYIYNGSDPQSDGIYNKSNLSDISGMWRLAVEAVSPKYLATVYQPLLDDNQRSLEELAPVEFTRSSEIIEVIGKPIGDTIVTQLMSCQPSPVLILP